MSKKYKLTFQLLILINVVSYSQTGTVDCSNTIHSKLFNKEVGYTVYLPEGYEESNRPYPILYLLHGMWGDCTSWTVDGEVNRIASSLIRNGTVPEMIIVMPDGLIDAFYINNYDKSVPWEDFFYDEFIPQIEETYRVIGERNRRAIAGLSMGGYGALYHAINHKEMFTSCYALSAAVLEVEPLSDSLQEDVYSQQFNTKLWGPMNAEGLPANYKAHSIQEIIKAMGVYTVPNPWEPNAQVALPSITIDCGDDDFLLKQNMNLSMIMNEKQIPFELRIRDGGHTWEYWRSGLELLLTFVGDNWRN